MNVVSAAALFSGTILTQTAAATPPHDPIPPSLNKEGYGFGAEEKGNPSALHPGPHDEPLPSDDSGQLAPHECETVPGDAQVCKLSEPAGEAPKISPAELAATEWKKLPIPSPVVRTAPPRRADGLVGLPEWFWVTNWRPRTGRAVAGGVWVQVTASPQSMTIDPGSGEPVSRCAGPGAAYDSSRAAASQRTDCSYTFTRSSLHQPDHAYRVRVMVTWGGAWVGSDGSGGALPPLGRSTTFPVRVAEAQGLYTRGAT